MAELPNPRVGYYGPVDEPQELINLEKTFMVAGYLSGVAYGVQLVLYCMCTYALWTRKRRTKFTYFLLVYIFILNAMNTIWTGTSAYGLQMTFIDFRNYPGGPVGFLGVEFSMPANILSLAALIAGNILADGLLLWRCYVIWTASLGKKAAYVMIFPVLMLLGSIAVSCLFALSTVSPEGLFSKVTINLGTPYFAVSLGLNIVLTLLIVFRMWAQRVKGAAIFGESYGKHYTSISTMFVESAALYSICSILLLGTYAAGHYTHQVWLGLAPGVQMLSSYLIIYRVVEGRAWTSDTWTTGANNASTFRFQNTTYGASETRVAGSHTDGTYQLNTLDDKNSGKYSGIQVLRSTEVASDKASWKSGREEPV